MKDDGSILGVTGSKQSRK